MKSRHDFPSLNRKLPDGVKPGGNPYGVLVVDDNVFHRKQLISILESEGYSVVAQAENGEEALKLYEEHKRGVDLITIALDMPVLDGYAFMYEAGQKEIKVCIVFISEDTTKGVIEDLLGMGAVDFVVKPLDRVMVLQRIKMALKRKNVS